VFLSTDDQRLMFVVRSDKALMIIVLEVEPNLLYLVGQDITNPVAVGVMYFADWTHGLDSVFKTYFQLSL